MACTANAAKISRLPARLGAGIARMSSQQAFFTGLAVGLGVAGAGLGALLVAKRQRLAGLWPGQRPRQALTVMGQAKPTSAARSNPRPIPILAAPSGAATPKPPPGRSARPIPGLASAATRLQTAPVQLQTGTGTPFLAQSSYRVLRADGSDTGLAVTPYLAQGDEGEPATVKPDTWSVTHTVSGALVDGPYESIEQAQGLATKLSTLAWSGTLSEADMTRAKRMIKAYRQTLAGDR